MTTTIPSSAKTRAFSQEMESLNSWFFSLKLLSHSSWSSAMMQKGHSRWEIPQVRKGIRSIMEAQEAFPFSFRVSALGLCFVLSGYWVEMQYMRRGISMGKEVGWAWHGPILRQIDFLRANQVGWELALPGAANSPACRAACELLTWAKSTLRIKLNMLMPKPGPGVTSALLSSEILKNQVEVLPWIQPSGRKHYCTHCPRWETQSMQSVIRFHNEKCCCCSVLINTWKYCYRLTQKPEKAYDRSVASNNPLWSLSHYRGGIAK